MRKVGTIREFKTRNFRVIVDAVEDDDLDLSWDDTGEIREKLENGELMNFSVRARVFHKELGELSADYLGGCIYESPADFMDHMECAEQTRKLREQGSDAVCGSYFADMVRQSVKDARKALIAAKGIKVRCNG
jgi:hypothetical protein